MKFFHLLLANRFLPGELEAAHFLANWLLDRSFGAKWAQLLITSNCCLSNTAKV